MRRIRAIIYGVGCVGGLAVRLMVEKGIDVVGAVNRPGPKIGRDLGELAGLGRPLGVAVDADADAVLSRSDADIALVGIHDDMDSMYPIYRQCIEHGLNVISVGAHASYPWCTAPDLTEALDLLARQRSVTITGGGNQDFFMVSLPSLATGISHRLESLSHRSLTDVNGLGARVMDIAHVGQTPYAYEQRAGGEEEPASIYAPFWENIASDLGLTITGILQATEPIIAARPVHCRALDALIPKGYVVGVTQRLAVDTLEGIRMQGEYTLKACEPGESEYKSWSLRGEPDLDIRLERLDTGFTTVSQAVNRIADVVDAEPGYVTLERLPRLRYRAHLAPR